MRGKGEDDAIATNAKVSVTDGDGLLRGNDGFSGVAVVYHDEIVAEALVLGELKRGGGGGLAADGGWLSMRNHNGASFVFECVCSELGTAS